MRRAALALGVVGGVLIILATLSFLLLGLIRGGIWSGNVFVILLLLVLAGACGLASPWLLIRRRLALAGVLQLIGGLLALFFGFAGVRGGANVFIFLVIGLGGVLLIIGAIIMAFLQRRARPERIG